MTTFHHIFDIAGAISLFFDFIVILALIAGRIMVNAIEENDHID